mmetsp:Transcript_49360/g.121145  ORF Transcript_49360/g.121145 Transcript_49360/m.121145 type:complete len:235 (-) Transcript_49360:1212-1916(-)
MAHGSPGDTVEHCGGSHRPTHSSFDAASAAVWHRGTLNGLPHFPSVSHALVPATHTPSLHVRPDLHRRVSLQGSPNAIGGRHCSSGPPLSTQSRPSAHSNWASHARPRLIGATHVPSMQRAVRSQSFCASHASPSATCAHRSGLPVHAPKRHTSLRSASADVLHGVPNSTSTSANAPSTAMSVVGSMWHAMGATAPNVARTSTTALALRYGATVRSSATSVLRTTATVVAVHAP